MKRTITQMNVNNTKVINLKFLAYLLFVVLSITNLSALLPTALHAQEVSVWEANFNNSDELPTAWRNESSVPNIWLINNAYEGSQNTPLQPKAISGSPNSRYLHISAEKAKVRNANYDASFQTYSEVVTPSISTLGYTNVQFSFFTICGGQEGKDYGQVFVSINNGEFEVLEPNIFSVDNWKRYSYPSIVGQFDNALVRFKFVWRNDDDNVGNPISFGIDELSIKGTPIEKGVIINESIPKAICSGSSFRLNYRSFGTFTLDNAYNVEISDDKGFFSDKPTVIGSLSSQLNSGVIFCNIPKEFTKGNYLLRVVSTKPVFVSANTLTLSLSSPALPGKVTSPDEVLCIGQNTVLTLSGFEGTILWEISYDGINFIPLSGTDLSNFPTEPLRQTTYYRARVTSGNCPPSYSNIIRLNVAPPIITGSAWAEPYEFCTPTTTVLTLKNYSDDAKIQWQESNDNLNFVDIANATTPTFTTPPISVTTYYRASVSTNFCAVPEYSNPVSVIYGLQVYCNNDPVRSLPGELVRIFVIATAIKDQGGEILFDPGDGTDVLVFKDVKTVPFVIEYTYNKPINANYKIIVKNVDGCEGTCEGLVTVNDQAILLTRLPIPFLCVGDTGVIEFTTKGMFGKSNTFVAEISDERGDFLASRVISPESKGDSVVFKIPMDAAGGGGYKIRIKSTSPIAYSDEVTGIIVTPAPRQGIISGPVLVCNSDTVTLNIDGQEPGAEIAWEQSSDGINFTPVPQGFFTQQKYFVKNNSYFRVKLTPMSPGGACRPGYSDTILVKVGMEVKCSYKPDPAQIGKPVIFSVDITNDPGPFLFDWQFGDGKTGFYENITSLPHVVNHTYEKTGRYEYSVKIKGKYCSGSCQATITVGETAFEVTISSITPASDQACGGDVWQVKVLSTKKPDTGNVYAVELSDETGSFTKPTEIGTIKSNDTVATVTATVPAIIKTGTEYKVRTTATTPKVASAPFNKTYKLNPKPAKPEIGIVDKKLSVKTPLVGTYTWYAEGSTTPAGTGATFAPTANAKYKVVFADKNSCSSESDYVMYTSMERKLTESNLKVYPNPFKTDFDIRMNASGSTADLNVFNMMGQKVASKRAEVRNGIVNESIDLSDEPSGVYFLKVVSQGREQVVKIVKQ